MGPRSTSSRPAATCSAHCASAAGAGGYGTGSGTSFSTPYVAGAAALLIASGVTDKNEIRTQLLTTATDLGAGGSDNLYGNGRLNVGAAIDEPGTATPTNTHTNTPTPTNTATVTSTPTPDTTDPSTNITSPANGAILALGNVAIHAFAADGGGMDKVRFWVDSTYLGFDPSAPYSKTWDASGAGPGTVHIIKIEAIDDANNSTIRTITVTMAGSDSTPPTASITSPAAGANVDGSVAISAAASDAGGIQKVRFWAGSTYLGFDSSAPYTKTWDSLAAVSGPHTIKVEAIDNANNSTITTIAVIKVSTDVTAPTTTITAPTDGSVVSGTVTLTATGADAGGIQKIRFWVDGTYLGYDATSPYQRSWNTTSWSNGAHEVKAQAVDLANNAGPIVTITVTVSN